MVGKGKNGRYENNQNFNIFPTKKKLLEKGLSFADKKIVDTSINDWMNRLKEKYKLNQLIGSIKGTYNVYLMRFFRFLLSKKLPPKFCNV